MRKRLGIGKESFPKLIEANCYYVDKTPWIKPFLSSGSDVHLITRPRRFGKSLFLSTLRTFLEINRDDPTDTSRQKRLFAGLKILEDTAFCRRFMGKFPVLYLNFKGIEGQDFSDAYETFGLRLAKVAREHAWLLESTQLSDVDKVRLGQFASDDFMCAPENRRRAAAFVGEITGFLAKHFKRTVILLIDEYDVPLAKASTQAYYDDMVLFLKGLLDPLKSGDANELNGIPVIEKAFLTGCLRVSKESIFTGLNNLDINTVGSTSEIYASAIGFTQREITSLLEYYGLESRQDTVKQWYDGYRFATQAIYCPWDVINFCKDALESVDPQKFLPGNYWLGTSDNAILDEFLGFMNLHETEMMQSLMDGKEILTPLNEQVSYADLKKHAPEDFWTLLLFSGYLTISGRNAQVFQLRIPNEEIRDAFSSRILKRFSSENRSFVLTGEKIARYALAGDASKTKEALLEPLRKYVSIRDSATRATTENYYHGFLNALLSSAQENGFIAHFGSNVEAGDGYADFLFTSADEETGVVIEIKHCAPREKIRSAQLALTQIQEKHYAEAHLDYGCRRIFGVGIAFSGKSCAVEISELGIPSLLGNERHS